MAYFGGVEITKELRPCIVNGEKALFHTWEQRSQIVPPSPMVGGHGGGVVTFIMGILEDEEGRVFNANPTDIRFVDNKIQEFAFADEGNSIEEKEL